MKMPNDKRLSLGVGILIDEYLKKIGLRERDITYASGEYGKPYFADYPDLHFSVTHSGNISAVAFSDTEIGCDTEKIGEYRNEVAKRFLHPEEFAEIEKSDDKCELFYRLWTLKEAYIKCLGCGFSMPFADFRISLSGEIPAVFTNKDIRLYEVSEISGYKTALCVKGKTGDKVEIRQITV